MTPLSPHELRDAYERAASALLAEATPAGNWVGELSASALSTATAIATLSLLATKAPARASEVRPLIERGLAWLATKQNSDGGWGDTILSVSNISTTMLARAAFVLSGEAQRFSDTIDAAVGYIDRQGGVAAVHARYGTDRTFSAPILTQCALAGLVDWREVSPLPFELAWLPHSFYKFVSLPVVSYALPALIAIGQVRHDFAPSRNPLIRAIRNMAVAPTLAKLTTIQPTSGGFLEATPLTSFVTMSLIAMGHIDHPVVHRGVQFLLDSVRNDGSWPIDTNLATWVTTLSVNGLDADTLPEPKQRALAEWLLGQQNLVVHPYTQAAPGGWAWTDLSGGVSDADDTPGAILALLKLCRLDGLTNRCHQAVSRGIDWLLDLQNRDGGWPTFCRGWGTLPFDRSSADITAHCLRAMHAWRSLLADDTAAPTAQRARIERAITNGMRYLARRQRPDGSWLPLWFGNQHVANEENPLYGTARVLMAFRDLDRLSDIEAQRGLRWLASQQNDDGGWGGQRGVSSSVEETALAVEALCVEDDRFESIRSRGLQWLIDRVNSGSIAEPSPIGFYFAKLWYFERLYPLTFTVSALRHALACCERMPNNDEELARSVADSSATPAAIPCESAR
ncbi:MAG: prenyltransferase/squalene oxidase repeat-containing protein [Planctomycetaceae bacterium]|nr:prenyltransferase/squalene oxidase repeat-containing protein [Planctomycetaceae bacterium]